MAKKVKSEFDTIEAESLVFCLSTERKRWLVVPHSTVLESAS